MKQKVQTAVAKLIRRLGRFLLNRRLGASIATVVISAIVLVGTSAFLASVVHYVVDTEIVWKYQVQAIEGAHWTAEGWTGPILPEELQEGERKATQNLDNLVENNKVASWCNQNSSSVTGVISILGVMALVFGIVVTAACVAFTAVACVYGKMIS